MNKITIGIIGARSRDDMSDLKMLVDRIEPILNMYSNQGYTIEFVSGGCTRGGDRFAEILASEYNIPIKIHYPDLEATQANDRYAYATACYARNTLIARDADILIAVVAEDRKGGTEDTIKKFKKIHPKGLVVLI
jgi:hypothetical protein